MPRPGPGLWKVALLLAVLLTPLRTEALEFFADDFESYVTDADVTAAGWSITNTAATNELEAQWTIIDTVYAATALGLPPGVHFGPGVASGGTTPDFDPGATVLGGAYMISFSDTLPAAAPGHPGRTFPAGTEDSATNNVVYSGASNDFTTPSFSTTGATGDVWLHASLSAQLGDGGDAIFDIELSTDGGTTWDRKFRRVAPGRDASPVDYNVDGDINGVDFLRWQRDDRSPASIATLQSQFGLTETISTNQNAGGVIGPLDLNLGPIGNQSDVRLRFRHFEQTDDEHLAIDNVVVNEVAPPSSGSTTAFSEDFNSKTLGQMGVYVYDDQVGPFLFLADTGTGGGPGGSGTISGNSWGAQDRPSPGRPNGRYQAGVVGTQNVNRLGHPTPEGASGEVPFAIIDSEAEEDGADPDNDSVQSERLHTPILDLTGYSTVILEWDDEIVYDGNPSLGSVASVVLIQDNGDGIPNAADTVLNAPNKLTGGNGAFAPYLPYDQLGGALFSGGDDPIFSHHYFDITAEAAGRDDLYVAFQFVSSDTDYWAVDNIRITGELIAPAAAVPEPTAALLLLLGILTTKLTKSTKERR